MSGIMILFLVTWVVIVLGLIAIGWLIHEIDEEEKMFDAEINELKRFVMELRENEKNGGDKK